MTGILAVRRALRVPLAGASARDPPHERAESGAHDEKRGSEEPQRGVEDGLRVHARVEDADAIRQIADHRLAPQPFGQRLLPREDVAAADRAFGVMKTDLAWQMQAEGDQLGAVPSNTADVLVGRRADGLTVDEQIAFSFELVPRPGKRR